MKRIAYLLFAFVTLTGVVVYIAHASGQADGEAAPIFGIKIPPGLPRLEVDLRGARRRQPQRSSRHSGQRCSDQGLPGRNASLSRTAQSLPGWPGVTSRRRKTTKSLAVPNLSWPGPPRTFSSWSRTQENTPRRAAGGLLNSKTANLPTRRCSKPASRATSLSKLATLSSLITHPDKCRGGCSRIGTGGKRGESHELG